MAKTTLAKIDANRLNALKSTGPKTVAGKRKASGNSLKHGILSSAVVAHHANESEADFNQLLSDLRLEFQPNGTMESILVERIAVCVWRLRRAVLVESAEIGEGFMDATIQSSPVPTPARVRQKILAGIDKTVGGYAKVARHERDKIRGKLKALLKIQKAIETQTLNPDLTESFRLYMPDPEKADVLDEDYRRDLELCRALEDFSAFQGSLEEAQKAIDEDEDFYEDEDFEPWTIETWEATQQEYRTKALAALDEGIGHYQLLVDLMERERLATLNARLHQPFLPSEDTLNRITRYETMLEKQLYRAIQELERLQKRRRGEVQTWFFFTLFAKRTQTD